MEVKDSGRITVGVAIKDGMEVEMAGGMVVVIKGGMEEEMAGGMAVAIKDLMEEEIKDGIIIVIKDLMGVATIIRDLADVNR